MCFCFILKMRHQTDECWHDTSMNQFKNKLNTQPDWHQFTFYKLIDDDIYCLILFLVHLLSRLCICDVCSSTAERKRPTTTRNRQIKDGESTNQNDRSVRCVRRKEKKKKKPERVWRRKQPTGWQSAAA